MEKADSGPEQFGEAAVLDYAAAPRTQRKLRFGRPVPWWFAAVLIAVWALPLWPSLLTADVDAFYMRSMIDVLAALFLGAVVGAVLLVRSFRTDREPTRTERQQTWLRFVVIVIVSLGLLYLDSTGLPLRIAFFRYRSEFEAARRYAADHVPPGSSAPYPPIGPFQIVSVRRGVAGGVALELRTGSGIEYGHETLLVPQGDSGPLIGDWHWEATD